LAREAQEREDKNNRMANEDTKARKM